jgi:hypothetical protein
MYFFRWGGLLHVKRGPLEFKVVPQFSSSPFEDQIWHRRSRVLLQVTRLFTLKGLTALLSFLGSHQRAPLLAATSKTSCHLDAFPSAQFAD